MAEHFWCWGDNLPEWDKQYRAKYLDQQDIEGLGFIHYVEDEELEDYGMYRFIDTNDNILTWINIKHDKEPQYFF